MSAQKDSRATLKIDWDTGVRFEMFCTNLKRIRRHHVSQSEGIEILLDSAEKLDVMELIERGKFDDVNVSSPETDLLLLLIHAYKRDTHAARIIRDLLVWIIEHTGESTTYGRNIDPVAAAAQGQRLANEILAGVARINQGATDNSGRPGASAGSAGPILNQARKTSTKT